MLSDTKEWKVRSLVQTVVYLSLINKKLGKLSIPKLQLDETIEEYVQEILKI